MFSVNSATKAAVVFTILIFPKRVFLQILLVNLAILTQSCFTWLQEVYVLSTERKFFRYSSFYLISLSFLGCFLNIGRLEKIELDSGKFEYQYEGFLPDEFVNHSVGKVQVIIYGLVVFINIQESIYKIFEETSYKKAKQKISNLRCKKKVVKFDILVEEIYEVKEPKWDLFPEHEQIIDQHLK